MDHKIKSQPEEIKNYISQQIFIYKLLVLENEFSQYKSLVRFIFLKQ
jgi:hypothetical protein